VVFPFYARKVQSFFGYVCFKVFSFIPIFNLFSAFGPRLYGVVVCARCFCL